MLKINKTFLENVCFTQSKNEAQLRQNSFLKRKMAACLRQQNSSPAPGLV
jgi:hypothetical protein